MLNTLAEDQNRLRQRLKELDQGDGLAVAYSGGLDSRLLVHACRCFGLEVLALHFSGPHIQKSPEQEALAWLEKYGVPHLVIRTNPLELPEVRRNAPLRCYHCKRASFGLLAEEVRKAGGVRPLCDGTLASDLAEYRPGIQALRELGVHSPLAEAGLSKPQVRCLAVELNLDNPAQPSQTCLLTRFDYGLAASAELLARLEAAEEDLAETLHLHFAQRPENRQQTARQACANLNLPVPSLSPLHLPDSTLLGGPAGSLPPAAAAGCPDPEFRLRFVADEQGQAEAELHLGLGAGELDEPLLLVLKKTLSRHGLERAAIKPMPRLSSFFDRKRRAGAEAPSPEAV